VKSRKPVGNIFLQERKNCNEMRRVTARLKQWMDILPTNGRIWE